MICHLVIGWLAGDTYNISRVYVFVEDNFKIVHGFAMLFFNNFLYLSNKLY